MQKEQAGESNVFQLNARVREPIDEPDEIPEHVRHRLAERTDALDQLMTILNGRRGH